MASQAADDDLQASKTEGFKVGEKKTVEEYAKLGESDLADYALGTPHSSEEQLTHGIVFYPSLDSLSKQKLM